MELWIAVCSFTGAVLGGTVNAYLTGMFTEKGKINASLSKLDALAKQMEVLTEKAETIKAQISGQEWDRQWVKNNLRDAYLDTLSALHRLTESLHQLIVCRPHSGSTAEWETARTHFDDALAVAKRALDKLEMFSVSLDAEEFRRQAFQKLSGILRLSDGDFSDDAAQSAVHALAFLETVLLKIAKKGLGTER
ncbi:MAG: hypothetical protein WKF37_18625 [Bryobacteraceae bacterium]